MEKRENLKTVYVPGTYSELTKICIGTADTKLCSKLYAGFIYKIDEDGTVLCDGKFRDVKVGDILMLVSHCGAASDKLTPHVIPYASCESLSNAIADAAKEVCLSPSECCEKLN